MHISLKRNNKWPLGSQICAKPRDTAMKGGFHSGRNNHSV